MRTASKLLKGQSWGTYSEVTRAHAQALVCCVLCLRVYLHRLIQIYQNKLDTEMRCTTCSLASGLTVVLLVMAIPSAARRPVAGLTINNFEYDISEPFEVAASPRTLAEAMTSVLGPSVLGPSDTGCQNFKAPAWKHMAASTCGAYIETDLRPLRKE